MLEILAITAALMLIGGAISIAICAINGRDDENL